MTYKAYSFLIFLWLITCNINGYGQDIVEIDIRYKPVRVISSGLIGVIETVKDTDYYGYINTKGETIIRPKYQGVRTFNDGITTVFTYEKKTISIDTLGNEILQKDTFEDPDSIEIISHGDSVWLADINLKPVTKNIYKKIMNLSYGFAIGYRDAKRYILNGKGQELGYIKRGAVYPFGEEERARLDVNGKWGFIDIYGDEVVSPTYEELEDYYGRFARFKLNGKYGLIDLKGKEVISPLYEELINLGEGYAITKLGSVYHSLDSTNTVIQTIEVDAVKEPDGFDEGKMLVVKHDNLYGAIDKKGNILIPPIYEQVSEVDLFGDDIDKYDLAIVKLDGKLGCINLSNGEIVLPIAYDDLLGFTQGHFVVKKGERFFIAKMK